MDIARDGRGQEPRRGVVSIARADPGAFNEYGAQIMSPHFESQPDRRVFVPKTEWYTAPAVPSVPAKDGAQSNRTDPKVTPAEEPC